MARGRKKKGKTGQQSMGGGDDNVGIAVPNNNETISGDGSDNVMDENRNNEGGNDVGNDANVVGKSSDGFNGDGDNCDGIVVGNLPVSGETVGERKKKVKTEQQSKGGGDDNVGLDVPDHNVTYSGDGNADDLDENRKMKEAKRFAMMPTMLTGFVILTMVMETSVMALLTILVTMTATMLVTHLPVVTLLVKEKKK